MTKREYKKRIAELEVEIANLNVMSDIAHGFHDLAITERDYERLRVDKLQAQIEALNLALSLTPFYGDTAHPDWQDYLATNLLDALSLVPDTGDWHGSLRGWCERTTTGKLKPNRTA